MINTIVSTGAMSKEEWREYRKRGIGGSDVAAICGLSKYKSAFQLWCEKTGNDVDDNYMNEAMYWGTVFEPIIRSEFTARSGMNVVECPYVLQHPEYPFMLANIDGLVVTESDTFIFEAKTANGFLTDEWENGVPYSYQLQIQHYMSVTELSGAFVAVLIGGNKFKYYWLERDDDLIEMIIQLEQEFWHYVETNTPPPIDGSEAAKTYINALFPRATTNTLTLNDSCLKLVDDYEAHQQQERYHAELKEKAANELKLLIGDNEAAVISNRFVTWKNISQERIDIKRLSVEQPDIYQQYLTKTNYRKFTIKNITQREE